MDVFAKKLRIAGKKFLDNRSGGGQNLERRNVEQSIFRHFEIANIKITKHELIDSFIFDFFFIFKKFFEHSKYSIIVQIAEY